MLHYRTLVGYKLVDSDQTKLGNNIAERIVYSSTQVEDDGAYAQLKAMELVSIKGGPLTSLYTEQTQRTI